MSGPKATRTQQSLKEALAGEPQATRRWLSFAQQADIEGCPPVLAEETRAELAGDLA